MCDAIMGATLFTLPGSLGSVSVGSALAAAGAVTSAVGAIQSGNAQQKMGEYNAAAALATAQSQEQLQRRQSQRILSQGRANAAANGLEMDGSPLEVMAQSAADAEMDALSIRYGGVVRAEQSRIQGNLAQKSGYMSAATNLLMGLSQVGRSGGKPVPASKGP